MEVPSVKTSNIVQVFHEFQIKYCIYLHFQCISYIQSISSFCDILTSSPSPQLQLQTSWGQILLILDLFITPHWMMYTGIWLIYSWEPTHTHSDIRKYILHQKNMDIICSTYVLPGFHFPSSCNEQIPPAGLRVNILIFIFIDRPLIVLI